MTELTEQSRTISWVDPRPQAEQALTMSGLDYLRAMQEGTIPPPPIASHIGLEVVDVAEGLAVMAATPDESHYNPIGSVHGGFSATLLDSVCGCAVQTTLPAGTAYTSLDLSVSFLRAITADTGRVVATGRVTKPGSRAAFVEAEIRDAGGRLLATATSTCLVFQP
ncbi:PaaI family thioesterase [Aeromicrobium chenweiae]|uniref:Aromatic compound degradation protein PaaI n=1 Tax=Aeromicrobium chenweiae TaxID=2079793 RepID=A0A2S0WR78_9ACTN|nr:PaaI family thioesterase [Aeromicrobium chenweiae]AWB93865.1 aromatic compound degradation protein PaaI [Aeromicrobium chenweiae]TGN30910.1 PaaI family thioesterase [Aeromicrobium chenweiae]